MTVRSVLGPPTMQDVVAEITRPAGEGDGGYARRIRSGAYRTIRMPVFDRFVAARRVAPWTGPAERFAIDTVAVGPLFEGHRTVQAEGRWGEATPLTASAGWYLVSTRQPLGALAAYLLEPASEDGLVTWNLLDRELQPHAGYPIVRLRTPPGAAAEALPGQ